MELIYQEMDYRNRTWLAQHPFIPDPNLLLPTDNRRCIAVVAEGVWTPGKDKSKIDQFIEENVATKKWIQPTLHHTFICLRPWATKGDHEAELNNYQDIAVYLKDALAGGYHIQFDRVIPVQTGITLCGLPSKDINQIRADMREKGFIIGERYTLDICHTTLLRNTAPLTEEEQTALLDTTTTLNTGDFLTLQVTHLHICEASWCMRETEYKRYVTVTL
jgi:hypothetical protein